MDDAANSSNSPAQCRATFVTWIWPVNDQAAEFVTWGQLDEARRGDWRRGGVAVDSQSVSQVRQAARHERGRSAHTGERRTDDMVPFPSPRMEHDTARARRCRCCLGASDHHRFGEYQPSNVIGADRSFLDCLRSIFLHIQKCIHVSSGAKAMHLHPITDSQFFNCNNVLFRRSDQVCLSMHCLC